MNDVESPELQAARDLREQERARYLEVNSVTYPDAAARWDRYEKIILDKYLPDIRRGAPLRHEQALDIAWIERDKHHTRVEQEKETRSWLQEAITVKAHSGRPKENAEHMPVCRK